MNGPSLRGKEKLVELEPEKFDNNVDIEDFLPLMGLHHSADDGGEN